MILKNLKIKNYKSIIDSGMFNIEDITTLVGKNESGKSAILEAIYKMNPVNKNDKYEHLYDYPRRYQLDYEQGNIIDGDEVVISYWQFSNKEIESLSQKLGDKFITSNELIITSTYHNTNNITISFNFLNIIIYLANNCGLSDEEIKSLESIKNFDLLKINIESKDAKSVEMQNFAKECLKIFPNYNYESLIKQEIEPLIPGLMYFTSYDKMPGLISINDLNGKKSSNKLQSEDNVFLAFLDYANISLTDLVNPTKLEAMISRLEAVSARISNNIFEYWTQNKFLKVDVRCDDAKVGDPAPFNQGKIISIRIRNTRHDSTVNFNNRSTGFVWFFSFLVAFSQLKKKYGDNMIILLDEPGLSLHAKAQYDLLRYIKEKLLPSHQVIITTHSPFMIDPDELLKCRTVEDVITNDGNIIGTKVGDQVLSTDKDTVFPLQAALGYEITQTLFVGENTLLVEGPSDLLYLEYFSLKLKERKREGLNKKWTISPTGGIDKISSFISLFYGKKLNIAVLSDYHNGDKKKVDSILKSNLLKQGNLLTANTFCDKKVGDIEDIIGKELYVEIINSLYQTDLQSKDILEELVLDYIGKQAKVLEELEAFNHYNPAQYLVNNPGVIEKCADYENALTRFENLFKVINGL